MRTPVSPRIVGSWLSASKRSNAAIVPSTSTWIIQPCCSSGALNTSAFFAFCFAAVLASSCDDDDSKGGSVMTLQDVRQKGKLVPSPPCSTLRLVPDTVRISVPPGGRVRGVMKWRATNHQGEGCASMTQNVAPGSYVVTFATAGGEPKLTAAVTITVK